MVYDPFSTLAVITGPAILTNACAILQNGASIRYNLAVTQWREFRTSLAADDGRLSLLFVDPDRALALAERRINLQLRALGLLNAGIALFGATTVCALFRDFLVQTLSARSGLVDLLVAGAGGTALAVLFAAIVALFVEGACSRAMIRLHPLANWRPAPSAATPPAALAETA